MQANRLVLDAVVERRDRLRYTPAGLPALDLVLRHASRQPEAGGERAIECELAAVAFGAVATRLATVPERSTLRCHGFIARRWRTGITLAMHVAEFELMTSEH